MADALKILVLFAAIDRLTAPLKKMTGGAKEAGAALAGTKREIAELERAAARVKGVQDLERQVAGTAGKAALARDKVTALQRAIAEAEGPTGALAVKLATAQERLAGLETRETAQAAALERMRVAAKEAGIDLAHLATEETRLADAAAAANAKLGHQQHALHRRHETRERGEGLKEAAEKHRERLEKIGGVALVGGMAGGLLGGEFVEHMHEAMEVAEEGHQAMAQVNAALESMGPKAHKSAAELKELSESLEDKSLFHADDILKKVTANMLTFGNISGEAFDRAQQAAVNMSTRLGQDLQSSTIQVGKALNDPIKGVTALRRVGVQLTEQQQKQVKAMVAAGDVAGAQKIILGELEHEFRNAAEAARKASPSGDMQQKWHRFQEIVGDIGLRVLPTLLKPLITLLDLFNRMPAGVQVASVGFVALLAVVAPLLSMLGGLVLLIEAFEGVTLAGLAAAAAPFLAIAAAIAGVIAIGIALYNHWGEIVAWFKTNCPQLAAAIGGVADWIKARWPAVEAFFSALWAVAVKVAGFMTALLGKTIGFLARVFDTVFGLAMRFGPAILAAFMPTIGIPILIYQHWGPIKAFFGRVWEGAKSAVAGALTWFEGLPSKFWEIGKHIIAGLLDALNPVNIGKGILKLGNAMVSGLKSVLGIHSPSRVFRQIGEHMMGGLDQGLGRGVERPLARLRAAGIGFSMAVAAPAAHAAPAAGAREVHHHHRSYHINVVGGGDAKGYARELMAEIRRIEASETRASYQDRD